MASNEITTSSASIKERWLSDIAPKFFDMDDINLLNVGVFGYINEAMSNMLEDSLNSSSSYYSEVVPSTAKLPQSIYAYASLTQDEDFNAEPAVLPITLAIRVSDIVNKAINRNGVLTYKTFLIDRHSQIILDGNHYFMFDYDIEIIVKELADGYSLTPVYNLDSLNKKSNIHNKYIKSVTSKSDGEDYLFMRLDVRQMKKERVALSVSGRDTVDTLSFEASFTGNLSHFNVFYQETSTSEPIILDKYFMDTLNPSEDNKFCFYEYLSRDKLRIFFSPYDSYFKPELGSKILVDVYTTSGSRGNFTYTGDDIIIKFNTDNEKIGHDYKGIIAAAKISGDSKGGKDGKTLNEIKKTVMESFTTRKGLINENDLSIFFNKYKNNSAMTFFKKRDDIITRLFSAFILLKDSNNLIVPTNTVNVLINETETLDFAGSYLIKPGMIFENSGDYFIPTERKMVSKSTTVARESAGQYVMTNPYLIQVDKNPMLSKYFINSMYDTTPCSHIYMNYNIIHEFIINNISFERDTIYKQENTYNVSFYLNTSLNSKIVQAVANGETKDIIVKGILKNSQNEIAMFDFTPKKYDEINQRLLFTARLKTTDYIDEDSSLEFTNLQSIYSVGGSPSFFVPDTNVKLELLVYYNGYEDKTKEKLNHLNELKDYALVTIFESDNDIEFIKNVSGILNSYTKLQKSTSENYDIFIKSVPMIRSLYISDSSVVKSLYNNIYYHAKLLIDNTNQLENNFDIDYKFYNTYGNSRYFKTNNKESLDRINISLSFRIKLMVTATNEITTRITKYIQDYIESAAQEDSSIYISNLMSEIKQNFSYVSYIEFLGINKYDQSIQVLESSVEDYKSLSKAEISNYVPEYININKSYDDLTGKLVSDIKLEFV